ncbi:DUF2087 domain-containing protein [Arcanobacterium canis]
MNSALGKDQTQAIKRVRIITSSIANPNFRAKLARLLMSHENFTSFSKDNPPFDWAHDGTIDTTCLRNTIAELENVLSEDLIAHVKRIDTLPQDEDQILVLSHKLVTTVFTRIHPRTKLSESELNCALAMFVRDVARVRRACVDAGILHRSRDGSTYQLNTEK